MQSNIYIAHNDPQYKEYNTTNTITLTADFITYKDNKHHIYKKNISYDFISQPNKPKKYSSIESILTHTKYSDINVDTLQYIQENAKRYVYTLYLRSIPWECNILCAPYETRTIGNRLCYKVNFIKQHVPESVLRDIRNNNCLLLLNDSYECTVLTPAVMETLTTFLTELQLPINNIIIVTGNNINTKKQQLLKYGVQTVYLQLFECNTKNIILQENKMPKTFNIRYSKIPKNLRFVYLNSSLRTHRIYMFLKLLKYNAFIRHSRTSFLTSWNNIERRIVDYEKLVNNRYRNDVFIDKIKEMFDLHNYKKFIESLPLKITGESDAINFKMKPWDVICTDIYDDISVHIVTETLVDSAEDSLFITEKTFKPIATMSPFIIFGQANILKALKEQGYMTFGELWNEDYDDIQNPIDRANAIIEVVKYIASLKESEYKKLIFNTQTILHHNYSHFQKRTPEHSLVEAIKTWKTRQ